MSHSSINNLATNRRRRVPRSGEKTERRALGSAFGGERLFAGAALCRWRLRRRLLRECYLYLQLHSFSHEAISAARGTSSGPRHSRWARVRP